MKIQLLSLAVLSASLLSTVHAKAATIDLFTLTNNSTTYSFSLPASPTPTFTGNGCIDHEGSANDFCVDPTAVTVNNTVHNGYSVEFFTSSVGGGLDMFNSSHHTILNLYGSQVFSGTVTAPHFNLGTYNLTLNNSNEDCDENCGNQSAQLVISEVPPGTTSPVPEPSSLVMMSSGLLAAAGAIRRKFKA